MEQKSSQTGAPPDVKHNSRGIIILGVLVVLLVIFKLFVYPHFE
ncbi:hypothetical protein ACLSU7_00695 [Bdellovibrio sp. HCB185ZH]